MVGIPVLFLLPSQVCLSGVPSIRSLGFKFRFGTGQQKVRRGSKRKSREG